MTLTDDEITRIENGEIGVGPAIGDRLIAQAREANALRAEVERLRKAADALTTLKSLAVADTDMPRGWRQAIVAIAEKGLAR